MAIAAQEQRTPEAPEPAQAPRRQRVVWPKPSQLRQSAPILRLLAEIWAIPQVSKIGIFVDGPETFLRVVVPDTDRQIWSQIFRAEATYLNSTQSHHFELQVAPLSKAPVALPPPFETLIER